MNLNRLSINYDKTNFIIFTKKKLNYKIRIKLNGYILQQVKETKYLGVMINEKLNWTAHINYIRKKLNRASYILSKLRHFVNIHTLKMVYYSLVHPHLIYCLTTWGGAPHSIMEPLFLIQRKIIRIITYSKFNDPTTPLFSNLKILKLQDLYKLNLSLLFHKINNNKIIGEHNLVNINDIHTHNTRLSNNNFYSQFHRTNLGLSTYSSQGIKIWKKIPSDIKEKSFLIFKKEVKKLLLKEYD